MNTKDIVLLIISIIGLVLCIVCAVKYPEEKHGWLCAALWCASYSWRIITVPSDDYD